MKRIMTFCAMGMGLLAVSGCGLATRDTWNDPGTWKPTGANEANLQAMIANPDDLYEGRGERGSSAVIATTMVNRVLTGSIAKLPTAGGLSFGGGTSATTSVGQTSAPQ